MSGLDIIRRVIQLTYSFVCFNEPFDAVIGVSLVFLGVSGRLLLYQYIQDYRVNKGIEMMDDNDNLWMLSDRGAADADADADADAEVESNRDKLRVSTA